MAIKYSKSIAWLEHFVNLAAPYVPLHKISAIRTYRVPKNKAERSMGGCLPPHKGKHVITLCIYSQELHADSTGWQKVRGYWKRSLMSTLETTAHEIAHVKYWNDPTDHTPDMFILSAKLTQIFARECKRLGIADVCTECILEGENKNGTVN